MKVQLTTIEKVKWLSYLDGCMTTVSIASWLAYWTFRAEQWIIRLPEPWVPLSIGAVAFGTSILLRAAVLILIREKDRDVGRSKG